MRRLVKLQLHGRIYYTNVALPHMDECESPLLLCCEWLIKPVRICSIGWYWYLKLMWLIEFRDSSWYWHPFTRSNLAYAISLVGERGRRQFAIHTLNNVIDQPTSLNNQHGSDLETFLLQFYSRFICTRSWIVNFPFVKRCPRLNYVKGKRIMLWKRSWVGLFWHAETPL